MGAEAIAPFKDRKIQISAQITWHITKSSNISLIVCIPCADLLQPSYHAKLLYRGMMMSASVKIVVLSRCTAYVSSF